MGHFSIGADMIGEQVDYDVADFDDRFAADKSVYAKFYTMPLKDEKASNDAGRAIFKDIEYVEIRAAGNANNIIQRKATDQDRQRFARQYNLFRAGQEEQLIGTPLVEVPWLTKSQVEELAYIRVRTLEALATVGEEVCQRMAGLRDLKNKATAIMEAADKAAPLLALQEENKLLKSQLEQVTIQLKELVAAQKKAN